MGAGIGTSPAPAQPRFVALGDKVAVPMECRGEELDASEVRSLWWRTAGVLLGLWILSHVRP